ncbi:MAG: hypothetical protein ABIU05_24955 [Nitrospirales bacterium]
MVSCPRCAGCTRMVDIVTEEETITVSSCLNCGHVGGDALIEHHHNLDSPPEPFRELPTPVFDPERQRERIISSL